MAELTQEELKQAAEHINIGVSALSVEMYPIADIKPYEKNSKVHDKAHIERLRGNIEREGLQESLLIEEDGTIVTGHGRFEAIKLLGWETIPVRVMRGYTKAQCMLHRVSSNLTVSNKFDTVKQAEELSEIQALLGDEVSLDDLAVLTGFSERDIEVLIDEIDTMADLNDLDFDTPAVLDQPTTTPDKTVESKPTDDKPSMKLSKLFGFDEVTNEQSRTIRMFLTIHDLNTPEALERYCQRAIERGEEQDDGTEL